MSKKKIIGIIIIVVVVIIGIVAFLFINHENQVKQEATLKAQIAAQAKQEAQLKQEQQQLKEQQTKQAQAQQTKKVEEQKEQSKSITQNTNNVNLGNEKTHFLTEMTNLSASGSSGGGHYGQLTQSEELYSTWDDELNKIWKVLESNLPKSEMNALTKNEVQWIQEKQSYMPAYNAAGGNGYTQAQSVEAGESLAQLTKERCYFLVNNYM